MNIGKTVAPTNWIYSLPDYLHILSIIWIVGVALCTIISVWELIKILKIKRHSTVEIVDGKKVYISGNEQQTPFSFGNIIVMNREDFNECRDTILLHELGHLKKRHIFDLIISQAIAILCWYNPAAWLMRRELKTVHEYQADDYVLDSGCDARTYQLLLIKKAVGGRFPLIANNLNYSQIRRRISMMNRSEPISVRSKLLYATPLVGVVIAVLLFSYPPLKAAVTPLLTINPAVIKVEPKRDVDNLNYFVDGKEIPHEDLNNINPSDIKSITVNKEDNRIEVEMK